MNYRPDGTIEKVAWWSREGAPQAGSLDPYDRVEAETICWSSGVRTETCGAGGMNVCGIDDGDYIQVKGVDFGDAGAATFTVSVASGSAGGRIELHLDGVDGAEIGTASVPRTGGWRNWKRVTAGVTGAGGRHDLYLVFRGETEGPLFNVDYWRFGGKSVSP
jgi:arabinoxylan arabinofuranohydrolase